MRKLILIVVLIAGCVPYSLGQNLRNRKMMQGFAVVNVSVAGLSNEFQKKIGVSKSDLQTQVELKLRQSGLRVIEKTKNNAPPLLWVIVTATTLDAADSASGRELGFDFQLHAVNVDVELSQLATLASKPGVTAYVGTWHSSRLSLFGSAAVADGLRADVMRVIDEFLNDFLAENPK